MDWKKSNISSSELEQKQQAYIKEALEMAKRSLSVQEEKAAERAAAEKAAAEKAAAEKAAAEKAAAEKAAAEKAAAEKAAAEKAAAEKAAAEKAAAEKAAAEKAAAEKAAAEKAAAEKAAAEKAAAEKAAAAEELTKFSDKEEALDQPAFAEEEEEPCADPAPMPDFQELTKEPSEKAEKCEVAVQDSPAEKSEADRCQKQDTCNETDLIDIAARKKQQSTEGQRPSSSVSLNQYISQHNQARCSCPSCQKKRAGQ
ncbi:MAG: histone H1-like repetitive region-containing protein [Firmicutes bacterium]|nr:histone H1-like repetitive region-containing protein [Bacillota bacterium]